MASQRLQYRIEADSTQAVAETEKVNRANLRVGETAEQGARQAQQAYGSFTASIVQGARTAEGVFRATGDAIGGFTHLIVRSGEAAVAGAVAIKSYATALAGFSTAASTVSASGEGIVNTYRLVRLALAPTPFTLATIAAGVLAEETIKLTYNTGKLVEARANLAARSGTDVKTISELAAASNLAGKSSEYYFETLQKLSEQQKNGVAGAGLKSLGIDPNVIATPELLGRIGEAFDRLRDPQQRARVAFQLFGDDFEKVLPQLNARLRETTVEVLAFSRVLNTEEATSIDIAKRRIDSLKNTFQGFFDYFKVSSANFRTELAVTASSVLNYVTDILRTPVLPEPGLSGKPGYRSGFYPVDAARVSQDANQDGRVALNRLNSQATAALANDSDAAFSIKERLEQEKSGVEAAIESAKTRRSEALSAFLKANQRAETLSILSGANLDESQRIEYSRRLGGKKPISAGDATDLLIDTQSARANFSQTVKSADQQVLLLTPQLEALKQAEKDKAAAETEAKALRTAIASRQKTIRDQGYTAQASLLDPFARSVLEFNKAGEDLTQIRIGDKVTNVPLSAEEAAARQGAFHALVLSHQKEQITKATSDAQALHELQLNYDAALFQRRTELRVQDDQRQIDAVTKLQEFRLDELGIERDQRIRALDQTGAQSVKQKVDLEKSKADIEVSYLNKVLVTRRELFDDATAREAAELRRIYENTGLDPKETASRLAAFESAKDQERANLGSSTKAAIDTVRGNAQQRSEDIQRDAALRQFESFKQSANGLLDSLFSRTKTLGQIVGDFFRAAVLTPLKELASSQIAKLLFEGLNPGQTVTFDSARRGGRFSGISSVLNGLGLGGASVRGFTGVGGTAAANDPTNGGGFNPLGTFSGATRIAAALASGTALGLDAETLGAGKNTAGFPTLPDGLIDRTGYSSSLDGNPASAIGPGGTSGFAGPVLLGAGGGYSTSAAPVIYSGGGVTAQGNSAGGSVLSLGQRALTAGRDFFGFGDGPGGTYGSGNYGTGIAGGLKSIGTSGFAAAVGGGLVISSLTSKPSAIGGAKAVSGGALLGAHYASSLGLSAGGGAVVGAGAGLLADGLHRGGKIGVLEDAAGGAAIGFEYGGPIGAAIGAAAGAIAGTVRLFISGGREQITKQVKDLYHIDINPNIADQLLQLAKESYGGSYSVAIRSKPALDLLSLYAQSTNQSFLFDNTVRPAYLTEKGGTAYQNPLTISNKQFSFGGALAVANGIPTSVIPSYVAGQSTIRSNGQNYGVPSFGGANVTLSMDGPTTQQFLQGQAASFVNGNPRAVASAVGNAQNGSYGTRASAARLLSPNLITG